MSKRSIVTEYVGISAISGSPAEETHHLIWGRSGALRTLADKDGLTIPLTTREHTGAAGGSVTERVHDNPAAEAMSKLAGQLAFEKEYYRLKLGLKKGEDPAREAFRKRYGQSYL
nr:MAG TPA: hypothetical protein [Caudoviricetes sp.]